MLRLAVTSHQKLSSKLPQCHSNKKKFQAPFDLITKSMSTSSSSLVVVVGADDSLSFQKHLYRLEQLELWRELAIRPQTDVDDCHEDDKPLLSNEIDDVQELARRSLHVRDLMNNNLPVFRAPLEEHLVARKSQIPQSGNGLYYYYRHAQHQPDDDDDDDGVTVDAIETTIPAGEILCYYYGHIHNFQSVRNLNDKSYLLLVDGSLFVDPRPCLHILARFINDPLNEDLVNCKFVPDPTFFRCAVVSTKEITSNSEIFVAYGDMYWSQQESKGSFFKG